MNLQIDKKYSPLFSAKPVLKTSVLEKNILGRYKKLNVNVVEIDVCSKSDMRMLRKLDKKWSDENKRINGTMNYYLSSINNSAEGKLLNGNLSNTQFYAITKQRYFFSHLNSKKILGAAQMNPESANLAYIQIRPKYQAKNISKRRIKYIGKQFLECLKKLVGEKHLKVYQDDKAKEFYRLQGAYPDDFCRDRLIM